MNENIKTREMIDGSSAIGEAVKACQPGVVAAFPITPQTHIVEHIAEEIAEGRLESEYILADSEFSVASALNGASATGVRSYTATASQGFLLMHEVLFNMAGTRTPSVITGVNRSLSPPINIQLDHQDTMSIRDPGIIQLYVEDIQEAYNAHIQAFKICEHEDVLLPIFVCCDGFIISHTFEPVSFLKEKSVNEFLPEFDPPVKLDPDDPITYGTLGETDKIMEFRYMVDSALESSKKIIADVAEEFEDKFEMFDGDLVEEYRTEDANIVLIAMGSMIGTLKEAADQIRNEKGIKVGVLKIRSYRPFPGERIKNVLENVEIAAVLDRNVSMNIGGILGNEIKGFLYNSRTEGSLPEIISYIAGLGGREINIDAIKRLIKDIEMRVDNDKIPRKSIYFDLNEELLSERANYSRNKEYQGGFN